MSTNTIRLHRVLRATPERVYRAFLDADAMAKWLPPNGFTGKVHQLGRQGRRHLQDVVHEFHHRPQPLLRRQVSRTGAARTHSLHGQDSTTRTCPARCQVTITLKKVSCGTELNIVQEGRARRHSCRGVLSRLAGIAHCFWRNSSRPRFRIS